MLELWQRKVVELAPKRVVVGEPADGGAASRQQRFDRLGRQQAAEGAHHRPDHAGFGAAVFTVTGFRMKAAVAG